MTTKELLTRLQYYSVLDNAAVIFSHIERNYIFQLDLVDSNNCKQIEYFAFVSDLLDYKRSVVDSCHLLCVSRFTRINFDTQLKYFKSFFNRCSDTQKEYVRNCLLVCNLLTLLSADSVSKK